MPRVTTAQIIEMKRQGKRVPMLTAYDYTTARLLDEAGVPLILVGDSLGNVMLGYETTIPVTMEEMLHHCRAVSRGARNGIVSAAASRPPESDLPVPLAPRLDARARRVRLSRRMNTSRPRSTRRSALAWTMRARCM